VDGHRLSQAGGRSQRLDRFACSGRRRARQQDGDQQNNDGHDDQRSIGDTLAAWPIVVSTMSAKPPGWKARMNETWFWVYAGKDGGGARCRIGSCRVRK
jgi:hypothetical protein